MPGCCKILSGQKGALLYSPVGSIVVLPSLIRPQQKNCMTEDVASLFSVKVATPPCAASKFKLCVENNPPYDCTHAEDSLFYEHRPMAVGFLHKLVGLFGF